MLDWTVPRTVHPAGTTTLSLSFSRRDGRPQKRLKVLSGKRPLLTSDVLWGTGRYDFAAFDTALWTEVDHPIGRFDNVQVVLNDNDSVALFDQRVEHFEQLAHVLEVQPGGGLVEDVERLPVARRLSSLASFTRWASPPESVVACWPTLT